MTTARVAGSGDQLFYFNAAWIAATQRNLVVDVCVYGGTAAGVTAAVTAVSRGHRVVLLQPGVRRGGQVFDILLW